jgi:hypothetical protein
MFTYSSGQAISKKMDPHEVGGGGMDWIELA